VLREKQHPSAVVHPKAPEKMSRIHQFWQLSTDRFRSFQDKTVQKGQQNTDTPDVSTHAALHV
jgi:hypothetical protein